MNRLELPPESYNLICILSLKLVSLGVIIKVSSTVFSRCSFFFIILFTLFEFHHYRSRETDRTPLLITSLMLNRLGICGLIRLELEYLIFLSPSSLLDNSLLREERTRGSVEPSNGYN